MDWFIPISYPETAIVPPKRFQRLGGTMAKITIARANIIYYYKRDLHVMIQSAISW